MDGVIDMAALTTWTDLEAARDAVAKGEIFAQGKSNDGNYEVRLRRHGRDAVAEVRLLGEPGDVWSLVESVDDDGVLDLRDLDTEVTYHAVV